MADGTPIEWTDATWNPITGCSVHSAYATFGHRGYPMPCVPLRTPPSLDRCLDMFVGQLMALVTLNPDLLEPLRGRDLGCWCKLCDRHRDGKPFKERCPDCAPCHADILGIVANGTAA